MTLVTGLLCAISHGSLGSRILQAWFILMKLMRPLVEESCDVTSAVSFSSASIFLASCFPSSTLAGRDSEDCGGEVINQ